MKIVVQPSDGDFRPLSDQKSDPIQSHQARTNELTITNKKKIVNLSAHTADDQNIQTDFQKSLHNS